MHAAITLSPWQRFYKQVSDVGDTPEGLFDAAYIQRC